MVVYVGGFEEYNIQKLKIDWLQGGDKEKR